MSESPVNDASRRARKGWARRRLNSYLKEIKSYLGHTPDSVTVWEEDYELLGDDPRITLKRGPAKPVTSSDRMAIHR